MTLRAHYWLTILAIVIIFAAGSAFALILCRGDFGRGDGKSQPGPARPETVPPGAWAETTLDRLDQALNLRPEQREAILRDIEEAELEVAYVREGAMLEYHLLLLRLHDSIEDKVDADQRRKLAESRNALERMFEHRLSEIVEDLPNHPAPPRRESAPPVPDTP